MPTSNNADIILSSSTKNVDFVIIISFIVPISGFHRANVVILCEKNNLKWKKFAIT